MARDRHTLFVTCGPGLEPVLHDEVRDLRLGRAERQVGGVRAEGTLADAWRANLWLRTATRVLVRLSRFEAPDADALYRGVREVDWRAWLAPGGTLAVDAQSKESALDHTLFVAQRTKDAVVDALREVRGERPSVDAEDPDLRLHVHLWRDRATLSVDASGESLHKRGRREAQGRAPLAETLAAGVVRLSGWDRRAPLVDPFCGSATIPIEAALWAQGRAPGLERSFAFERWPGHDAAAWERLRTEARERERPPGRLRLLGVDADADRVAEALANVAAAGLEGVVEVERGDAESIAWRPGWNAWIVTNPPYGERVGRERDLVALYRAFGERLRERCAGYRLALLTGDKRLSKALALKPTERYPLANGGLPVELGVYDLHT